MGVKLSDNAFKTASTSHRPVMWPVLRRPFPLDHMITFSLRINYASKAQQHGCSIYIGSSSNSTSRFKNVKFIINSSTNVFMFIDDRNTWCFITTTIYSCIQRKNLRATAPRPASSSVTSKTSVNTGSGFTGITFSLNSFTNFKFINAWHRCFLSYAIIIRDIKFSTEKCKSWTTYTISNHW